MAGFARDFSLTTVTAGLVATLVGFTSSIAIIFSAAKGFGADAAQIGSWVWALCIGCAICSIVPSLILRMPVMIAWSTPGAVVLATAAAGGRFALAEAMGAFIVSAGLIVLAGATRLFERLMNRIPMAVASALLAGVLARFAMQAFGAAGKTPGLVIAMLLVYLLGKRFLPRYAVVLTLLAGVLFAWGAGMLHMGAVHWGMAVPLFTMPRFTWQAITSLALPLFVVTMASQNLPGVAVARATGYPLPISPIITFTALVNLLLAPFGGYALNLAAITAGICMGDEAHPDRNKRYTAAIVWGVCMLVIGVMGVAVAGVLQAFPAELVQAIAGLALLSTIGSGLVGALEAPRHREVGVITFLVTLSGVELLGIGSAFWGVVAGVLALLAQNVARPRT
ncbi:MAG: benzoate/H(+) symporter BenE family transporter [Brachymonas sp.]|nr:benzoate/H(+) symporter BenE family transporter [Brachymonas sp.]